MAIGLIITMVQGYTTCALQTIDGYWVAVEYVWVVATTPSFLETYEYIEDPTICCSQGLSTQVSSQLSNYQANARYNQQV